jgi:hypothetical protein
MGNPKHAKKRRRGLPIKKALRCVGMVSYASNLVYQNWHWLQPLIQRH